jgi:Domain of unknown function (DUF4129)
MEPRGRTRWRKAIAVVVFACCAGVPALAQSDSKQQTNAAGDPTELDLQQYEAQLDRCASAARNPPEARDLEKSLPDHWAVRTDSGTVIVSTDTLREDLRKIIAHPNDSKDAADDLRTRAGAMRAAAQEARAARETGDAGEAQKKLETIFQRKEYAGAEGPSPMETYMARLVRWLVERIARVLMRLHLGARTGDWLAWTVIGIAFLCVCYVSARWLMGVERHRQIATSAPSTAEETRHWIAEAMAAAERGDYREAIHCAYWATVAKLEEIGALKKDRARTPRESLRLLKSHPEEQRLFRPMTGRFEVVWYGNRPATADDWAGAREEMEKIACRKDLTAQTASY